MAKFKRVAISCLFSVGNDLTAGLGCLSDHDRSLQRIRHLACCWFGTLANIFSIRVECRSALFGLFQIPAIPQASNDFA